jgi:hypothetical protein
MFVFRSPFVLILFLGFAISSCGDPVVRPAKPDPNQIMSIKNLNLQPFALPATPSIPHPIPVLPRNQFPEIPFEAPPQDPSPVAPLNLESDTRTQTIGVPERVNDLTVAPFNTAGKLTFRFPTDPADQIRHCTAQFVGDSGDVILTAAHCVYQERWAQQFVFKLGEGGPIVTNFDWKCTAIWSGWAQKSWTRDYAFIKLKSKSKFAIGMRTGLPHQGWTSIGYPNNFDFGARLWKVDGIRGRAVQGAIQMAENPFGPGSSGGAWIVANYAIGVNSFKLDGEPNSVFGPILDSYTTKLYEFVRNDCTGDTIPIGQSSKARSYNPKTAAIDADAVTILTGPTLEAENSPNCQCSGAQEVFVRNQSGLDYEVTVTLAPSTLAPYSPGDVTSLSVLSEHGKKTVLGCSRGDNTPRSCDVATEYTIVRNKRRISTNVGVTQSISPEFCADQCVNHPNAGWCLPLGNAAKPILVPLSGFVSQTLTKNPSNGIVATIPDLIKSFGGDEAIEDPCSRGPFFLSGNDVSNSGMHCRVTSAEMASLPNLTRLSLLSPPDALAARKNISAQSNRGDFSVRQLSPVLEFYGPGNVGELNKLYGGYVLSVQRTPDSLILSTENGCLIGPSK